MFMRSGKLVLVSALCVLASASAHAAGEFEAAWRAKFVEGYVKSFKEVAGDQPDLARRADEVADCYVRYVMQEFTPDEVVRLDSWATGGKSPGKDVVNRLARRSIETAVSNVCQPEKTNDPVSGAAGNQG
jgi:hypothetical protein